MNIKQEYEKKIFGNVRKTKGTLPNFLENRVLVKIGAFLC